MGNMLYKKYVLYKDGMEIMVPSHLHMLTQENHIAGKEARMGDRMLSNYNWLSDDKRVVINVTSGGNALTREDLLLRLQDYYTGFQNNVVVVECVMVCKRGFNGYDYWELQYRCVMMGYAFFNIFILGVYEGKEIILTLQCMERDQKAWFPIFMNVSDSLRILRKKDQKGE